MIGIKVGEVIQRIADFDTFFAEVLLANFEAAQVQRFSFAVAAEIPINPGQPFEACGNQRVVGRQGTFPQRQGFTAQRQGGFVETEAAVDGGHLFEQAGASERLILQFVAQSHRRFFDQVLRAHLDSLVILSGVGAGEKGGDELQHLLAFAAGLERGAAFTAQVDGVFDAGSQQQENGASAKKQPGATAGKVAQRIDPREGFDRGGPRRSRRGFQRFDQAGELGR